MGAERHVAIRGHAQVRFPGCVDLGGLVLLSVRLFVGESEQNFELVCFIQDHDMGNLLLGCTTAALASL